MIYNSIGVIIGIMILVAGIYYMVKEKDDKEARKMYSVVAVIGGVIVAVMLIKWIIAGL